MISRILRLSMGAVFVAGTAAGRQPHGRRRRDVAAEEHRRERGQLRRPHHAGRRGEGRGARRARSQSAGPFTVFAPTNEAFAALPAGTVETLLKPENNDQLVEILTCHVVAGDEMSAAIEKAAMQYGGRWGSRPSAAAVTAMARDGVLMIRDGQGNVADVTIADVTSRTA